MMKSHQPPSLWLAPGLWTSRYTPERLIKDFCFLTKVTIIDIRAKNRNKEIVQKRQMLARLIRMNFTECSLHDTGDIIDRDHATVLHCVKIIQNMMDTNKKFRNYYNDLVTQIEKINSLQQPLYR